ncbi:MAG: hypothetical protein ACMUJM_00325 [bacterium]
MFRINKKSFIITTAFLFCVILLFSPFGNAQIPPWFSPVPTPASLALAPIPSAPAFVLGAEAITFIAPTGATTIPAAYFWLTVGGIPTKLTNIAVPTTIYIVPPAPPAPIDPPVTTVALTPAPPTAVLPPVTTIAPAPPTVVPATTLVNVLPPTTAVVAPAVTALPIPPVTTTVPAVVSALGFAPFQLNGFNPFFNPFFPFGIIF